MNNPLKLASKVQNMLKIEKLAKKGVSRPNKEKRTCRHICAFTLMLYVRTYPLGSFLSLSEQFCHLLRNELDHYALVILNQSKRDFWSEWSMTKHIKTSFVFVQIKNWKMRFWIQMGQFFQFSWDHFSPVVTSFYHFHRKCVLKIIHKFI